MELQCPSDAIPEKVEVGNTAKQLAILLPFFSFPLPSLSLSALSRYCILGVAAEASCWIYRDHCRAKVRSLSLQVDVSELDSNGRILLEDIKVPKGCSIVARVTSQSEPAIQKFSRLRPISSDVALQHFRPEPISAFSLYATHPVAASRRTNTFPW